jgi:hypothetical protein
MTADAPDFSAIPIYHDFFEHHNLYERYHVHVIGLMNGHHPTKGAALKTRRNVFGSPRVIDALADPYLTIQTVADDTGSTDYFPIGYHKFPVLTDCQTPLWDAKCVLLAKKQGTQAIEFTFLDHNKGRDDILLFSLRLDRSEMPPTTRLADSIWTRVSKIPDHPDYQDVTFEFQIMVTDGSDRIVTLDDYNSIYDCLAPGYSYSETVVHDDSQEECDSDNALLQSWRRSSDDQNTKAVLWILGRNDCFMNPHVARRLFLEQGYDLYVLNYKMNGHCRKKRWVVDPHFNSHNKAGDFDIYVQDIDKSVQLIMEYNNDGYEIMLGYVHSTGGPVLLNYMMEKGDTALDAFVFNSPFLDWGHVGGDLCEFVLEHTDILGTIFGMENDTKMDVAATPVALADTPLMYCGRGCLQ